MGLTGFREGGIGRDLWVSLDDREHDEQAGDAVGLETVMQCARECDIAAAVGSQSKAVSDTASCPVCCDSAERVFTEGIILQASHENQKGAGGKRGLTVPSQRGSTRRDGMRHQPPRPVQSSQRQPS